MLTPISLIAPPSMGIIGRLTRYGTSCPYSSPWVVLCHLAKFCGLVGLLFHNKQRQRRPERDVTSLGPLPSLEYSESLQIPPLPMLCTLPASSRKQKHLLSTGQCDRKQQPCHDCQQSQLFTGQDVISLC